MKKREENPSPFYLISPNQNKKVVNAEALSANSVFFETYISSSKNQADNNDGQYQFSTDEIEENIFDILVQGLHQRNVKFLCVLSQLTNSDLIKIYKQVHYFGISRLQVICEWAILEKLVENDFNSKDLISFLLDFPDDSFKEVKDLLHSDELYCLTK